MINLYSDGDCAYLILTNSQLETINDALTQRRAQIIARRTNEAQAAGTKAEVLA